MIQKLCDLPAKSGWSAYEREDGGPLGEGASPCLAMARLAYKAGDIDNYNYASYMFARQLVHEFVKPRREAYLRQHPPWHSVEFSNRWVRFNNEDLARFYREYLRPDVQRELDLLLQTSDRTVRYTDDPRGRPSLVHLRSLLLNDTPAQLATVAKPDQFSGPPSGVIASCFSVLRTSHPTRYQRLIPGGEPSPFVAGLERELATPAAWITQRVQTNAESTNISLLTWPEMVWWENLSTTAGHRWTFGQVSPLRNGSPAKIEAVPLNWNTAAFLYRFEIP